MRVALTLSPSHEPDLTIDEPEINLSSSFLPDPTYLPPYNEPQQLPPRSSTTQAESDTILSRPPVTVTAESSFNIVGVHGDFITTALVQYWGGILGGEKWIKMVQSYLDLERMPLNGTVCDFSHCF